MTDYPVEIDRAAADEGKKNDAGQALYTGRVKTEIGGLNVRRTPGGEVIGMLERGEEVAVLGDEGTWLTIEYGDGIGYVSKMYIAYEKEAKETTRLVIEDEAGNVFIPEGGYSVRMATGPID